jgi:dTDP-4-dehydrorhamnose reductase
VVIFEIKVVFIKVNPIESSPYPTPAQRYFYTMLNKTKIKELFQVEVPYLEEVIG